MVVWMATTRLQYNCSCLDEYFMSSINVELAMLTRKENYVLTLY